MYFPNAKRKVFVGSGAIRTSGHSADLKAGELGLFDAETFRALAPGVTYTTNNKVVLAQGSFHQKDVLALGHGGLKESIKSRPIHGAHITDWRFAGPQKPQSHVVTIGYDGVDTTKTISAKVDTGYTLRIFVKGSPSSRFFQHDIYHDFFYKTVCPADCTDGCADPTSPVPMVEDYVKQINTHPFISPFVKAEALYDSLAEYPSVDHTVYRLSLCDAGDSLALASVQAQYPSYSVSLVERNGTTSVYEMCIPDSAGAPSAYASGDIRVIPNCSSCPPSAVSVGTLYKFEVKRVDVGDGSATTSVTSAYSSSPAATRINYENGTSTYIIYKSTAAVPAASGTDKVIQAGVLDAVCVLQDDSEVAWVDSGARYKTTRTLKLTLAKTCGGSNRLTELQAFYASEPTIASSISVATAGDCADVYTVTQYNNECLLNPCESHDNPTFNEFQAFEGQSWIPTDVAFASSPTAVGIRLTSAYVETKFGECSFDPLDHYELDIPKISVSQVDESGEPCATVWPVTELQQPKYARNTGEYVKRELLQFMRYKKEEFFTPQGSRMNETQDINSWASVIDRNAYYKIYYLVYNVPYNNSSTNLYDNEQYELMIVFPETADTSSFENLINGYVTSVGVQLKAV